MSTRARIVWALGFAILLSLLAIRTADAYPHDPQSLNDHYPTDQLGRVQVPAIAELASAITGRPTITYCTPTSEDYYGWVADPDDPDSITEVPDSNGEDQPDWQNLAIYISGDICSQLERLTRYPETAAYFRQRLPTPQPVKKGKKTPPQIRWDIWPNENTYNASVGLLTLVHEALHIRLGSLDEGLVECTAIHNIWPTLAALHLPKSLNRQILADARDNHFQAPDEYKTNC